MGYAVRKQGSCRLCGSRMGRRAADSRGAMSSGACSEPGCLRDHRAQEAPHPDTRPRSGDMEPEAAVKKHQHKHNLKHRYEVMETLGRGTYGKVRRAVERTSQKTVAIKSIRKEHITDDLERVHIQREIEITSKLRHPNIIRFYEVFESRDKIVIVMEFASRGELYDYIQERRRLPEAEARNIFRQITSAVHYCHKLADFGLSNNFQNGSLLQTYCGSPLYAAPEIVKGLPYQGPEVDCWALGVLLYALVYSSMPFDGASHTKLTEQITQGQYRRPTPPSDACALIDWLLTVRADKRATIEDVANHWWVNWGYEESVCDCPSSLLQECPSPLLARYIDSQNQVSAVDPESPCAPQLASCSFYFTLPLKSDRLVGKIHRGISSLRKSRKENVIPQTPAGACSGSACATAGSPSVTLTTSTVERNKPKGILKHQRSLDSIFHSPTKENSLSQMCSSITQPYSTDVAHADVLSPSLQNHSTFSQPSTKVPKKGILKNFYGGELTSGSSSENKGAGVTQGEADDSCPRKRQTCPPVEDGASMRTDAFRRRKGILKRTGKFSRSLDLSDSLHSSPSSTSTILPEALHQFLHSTLDAEGRRSRPSSIVSEDSLFSSDSFDLLDLSAQEHHRIISRGLQQSAYSFEEDLEPLRAEINLISEDKEEQET
ncbi:NUAK family SNF1-like kinase 1 isoform X2 [Gouania willdenowi]|uniref:NUAK family SNF1-like kinase 1 isoform X2 n=1 Tax=Gouania willdenowi TaxID=441366 RepID=UPI001054A5D0|nr:NUAK family SNF1-like kinase 1 isoform X2 [Gouania willdenowi]